MRTWLGVIGRACIEFLLILLLLSVSVGATLSLDTGIRNLAAYSTAAALDLIPLAVALTLFLAFFSFEHRIQSRLAGWLGLLFLGAFLLAGGLMLRRMEFIKQSLPTPMAISQSPLPNTPGISSTKSNIALWYKEMAGGDLIDAVAVDFGSDYPRMSYAARSFFDPDSGLVEIAGRSYDAARPLPAPIRLVPEASAFAGAWIWDRLAMMGNEPLLQALAAAGGFILLLLGFRFLCRVTGWPLANAVLAAAGFVGILVLDAVLAGAAAQKAISGIARELGIALPPALLLAGLEGGVGFILAMADLAAAPRRGRASDE